MGPKAQSPAVCVDVTQLLSYRILTLSNTLGLWAAREYPERFGITLPEWRVLSVIAVRGTLTAKEIVESLSTDKAWVSRILSGLEDRKLVQIRPGTLDRRSKRVELTRSGQALCVSLSDASAERQARLTAQLQASDLEQFAAVLQELQSRAERMLEEQGQASSR
jgi:DNA-binding MarR family transcriptional regulator